MLDSNFKGAAKRLDGYDIPNIAKSIGVTEDHFRAFFEVESAGGAFDAKGRPKMLFEPHVFWRNLPKSKRAVAQKAGLAYPVWGEKAYPKDSYPRLKEAMKIDVNAALKACSIGLSQVLVENYEDAGYGSPTAMWQAFMDDEEEHVKAMAAFIMANGIADDLLAERWEVVARVYNGPGYAKHGYHTRLAKAYAKFQKLPDYDPDEKPSPVAVDPERLTLDDKDTILSVQQKLIELGYPEVGKADSKWGSKTRAAVLAFRADNGLPTVPDIDNRLLTALMTAPKRKVAEARATATAEDLAKAEVPQVISANKSSGAGYAVLGSGGLLGVSEVVSQHMEKAKSFLSDYEGLIDSVKAVSPWLLLGLGAYIVYQQVKARRATVEDYREGRYVGR